MKTLLFYLFEREAEEGRRKRMKYQKAGKKLKALFLSCLKIILLRKRKAHLPQPASTDTKDNLRRMLTVYLFLYPLLKIDPGSIL